MKLFKKSKRPENMIDGYKLKKRIREHAFACDHDDLTYINALQDCIDEINYMIYENTDKKGKKRGKKNGKNGG
ncbi:MAG: hypothetical protein NC409_11065 [Clostridium sp.]|nr:hypothetical protein [Clostridium sp.]